MSDLLSRKLGASDFAADKYVKELTQQSVGGHDLLQQKQKIVALSEETNQLLKKNVYRNYMQFIETAKEISFLESEMYQLSHLLTDQKTLLVTLLETSVLGDKPPGIHGFKTSKLAAESPKNALSKNEEEKRKQLTALLEKVEGCASIVEVPTRLLIHEGDMVELDPSDNSAIQRVRGYLLNDSLMIATWLRNRRGPMRYQYQALYELERLAVVNIRDLGPVKHAFKLMMFPDTCILQCANAADKKQWLDAIDAAKKAKLEQPSAITTYEPKDHESHQKEIPLNPFDEEEQSLVSVPQSPTQPESVPDWVNELSDDLEVCIAQRDFEEAVALVEKNRSFWDQANPTLVNLYRDLKTKIDSRVNQLGQVLANELRVSPDKSLQGGPRAARRALMLLTRLGKATLACDLFLKHRSALLKRDLRQLPTEGAAVLYIKRLAGVFFPFLIDTGREVTRAFANIQVCLSAFVVWARHEVHKFCRSFKQHVFTPQSPLSSIAECVVIVRTQSQQMLDIGLDLIYYLESELSSPVERCLRDAREKLLESVKMRALEDKWRPLNLVNKAGLQRFSDDLSEIGISSIHAWVYDQHWVSLTSNTANFSKAFLSFVEDVLKLGTAENESYVDSILHDVFQAQMKHVESSLKSGKYASEAKFIQKNASFLVHTVLPLSEHQVEQVRGRSSIPLERLRAHYEPLCGRSVQTKASPVDPTFL